MSIGPYAHPNWDADTIQSGDIGNPGNAEPGQERPNPGQSPRSLAIPESAAQIVLRRILREWGDAYGGNRWSTSFQAAD